MTLWTRAQKESGSAFQKRHTVHCIIFRVTGHCRLGRPVILSKPCMAVKSLALSQMGSGMPRRTCWFRMAMSLPFAVPMVFPIVRTRWIKDSTRISSSCKRSAQEPPDYMGSCPRALQKLTQCFHATSYASLDPGASCANKGSNTKFLSLVL